MTEQKFEKGFKLLKRFFKEINRYNDFVKISAEKNPKYKQILKCAYERNPALTWHHYFTFAFLVGNNYEEYNDPGLNTLRKKWLEFINKYPY